MSNSKINSTTAIKAIFLPFLMLFGLLFSAFYSGSESSKIVYQGKNHHAVYSKTDGKIEGKYESFYENGNLKSRGYFKNNYRIGQWTLLDAYGKEVVTRNYSSPFSFELQGKGKVFTPEYNEKGFISYSPLSEENVLWSKRVWRRIDKKNNPILFGNDVLMNCLESGCNSTPAIYCSSEDQFIEKMDSKSIDFDQYEVVSYKIKEDWFFDTERKIMEARIIGICPVVITEHGLKDLAWMYFPSVREHLAKINVAHSSDNINTLDDLFFYRDLASSIYKINGGHEFVDYCSGAELSKEAQRIEVEIIEAEHKLWLD